MLHFYIKLHWGFTLKKITTTNNKILINSSYACMMRWELKQYPGCYDRRAWWLAEGSWGGDPTETLIRACLARLRLTLLIDIHYLEWLFIPAKYPEEVLVCLCISVCECVGKIQIALCYLLRFQLGERWESDSWPGGVKMNRKLVFASWIRSPGC